VLGRKTCPTGTFSTKNATWSSLGVHSGLRDEKQETNRLAVDGFHWHFKQEVLSSVRGREAYVKLIRTFFAQPAQLR
jgi:hypothetical protein